MLPNAIARKNFVLTMAKPPIRSTNKKMLKEKDFGKHRRVGEKRN
jgi:hypothetical protein